MSSPHPPRQTGVGEHHLARLAEQAYERRGDYPALLYDGTWLSSGEIFDRPARLGGGFTSLGLNIGERVVVTMANCPEVSIVYQRTPSTTCCPWSRCCAVSRPRSCRAPTTTWRPCSTPAAPPDRPRA